MHGQRMYKPLYSRRSKIACILHLVIGIVIISSRKFHESHIPRPAHHQPNRGAYDQPKHAPHPNAWHAPHPGANRACMSPTSSTVSTFWQQQQRAAPASLVLVRQLLSDFSSTAVSHYGILSSVRSFSPSAGTIFCRLSYVVSNSSMHPEIPSPKRTPLVSHHANLQSNPKPRLPRRRRASGAVRSAGPQPPTQVNNWGPCFWNRRPAALVLSAQSMKGVAPLKQATCCPGSAGPVNNQGPR